MEMRSECGCFSCSAVVYYCVIVLMSGNVFCCSEMCGTLVGVSCV